MLSSIFHMMLKMGASGGIGPSQPPICDPLIIEARYGGGRLQLTERWQAGTVLLTPALQNDAIQEP